MGRLDIGGQPAEQSIDTLLTQLGYPMARGFVDGGVYSQSNVASSFETFKLRNVGKSILPGNIEQTNQPQAYSNLDAFLVAVVQTAYEEQQNNQPFPSLNDFDTPQEAAVTAVQIASEIPQPTGLQMAFPATSCAFMKIVGVPMAQSIFIRFKDGPPGDFALSKSTIGGQAFLNTAAGQTLAILTGGNPYPANISAVSPAQLEQFYYAVDIYFALIWKRLVYQGQPLPNLSVYGLPVA